MPLSFIFGTICRRLYGFRQVQTRDCFPQNRAVRVTMESVGQLIKWLLVVGALAGIGWFVYMQMNKPATTLVPGHNAFPIHPLLPRALTVREAARIQTIPDKIRFVGTRQQQCMLVGNAVPPLLASQIAQAVSKALDRVYADPGYKRDIYDLRTAAAVA